MSISIQKTSQPYMTLAETMVRNRIAKVRRTIEYYLGHPDQPMDAKAIHRLNEWRAYAASIVGKAAR